MEKESSAELNVKIVESCLVPPCLPSPKATLYLSNIDNQLALRTFFDIMLVYEAGDNILEDPVKKIKEALSKVLVYYYPLAGRLRKKEDGKLQVECTGEGIVFVEAMADNNLSVLGDLNELKPSFRQLLFQFPSNTDIEDLHLVILQVTHFICGGFVVAAGFYHSVCDGRRASQFLKGLVEMVRGDVKPSIEPIWERELLMPRNPLFSNIELTEQIGRDTFHPYPPLKYEELVQSSLIIDFETIKYMKQGIMQECVDLCSTFEIVAALVWRARTKALEISHTITVKLIFAVDVRRSFNPPLKEGYYGNGFVVACALATVHELLNEPLSHIVNIIRKSKISLNDKYLRSIIDMDHFPLDIYMNQDNLIVSDWRWLGFNEVDIGLGSPINVSPVQWNGDSFNTPNFFIFLHHSTIILDGFKILVWMYPQAFISFEMEIKTIIENYVPISRGCDQVVKMFGSHGGDPSSNLQSDMSKVVQEVICGKRFIIQCNAS